MPRPGPSRETRPPPDPDARPSKTALKQDAHEMQSLGVALAELPADALAALPMPESLLDALREFQRTRSHEGRRRQMQFVGKLMRQADLDPLREAVAARQLGSAKDTLLLHRAEGWRAALVADDNALDRWCVEQPASDVQQLRSLIRSARKEAAASGNDAEQRHGRAWRELFQFIKPQLRDE